MSLKQYFKLLAKLEERQKDDSLTEEEELTRIEELHDLWHCLSPSEKEKLEDERC